MPNTATRLASTVLTGTQYQVALQNIPQTYTDLKLVLSIRGDWNAATDGNPAVFFNNLPTAGTYGTTWIQGNGSTVVSSRTTDICAYMGPMNAATSTAGVYTSVEIYIPNYTGSNRKAFTIVSVSENVGTQAFQRITSGSWTNTAAISRIDFYGGQGNFIANSTFTLYGIKNT